MPVIFVPMPTPDARAYQAGGFDANDQTPEWHLSDNGGNPCRHCLRMVPIGAGLLVLAHRPFPAPQPYAEVGPIFLCADATACQAPPPSSQLPRILASPDYVIRGYGEDHRIVYGTGAVVPTVGLAEEAEARLADPRVAYLHVRSARNSCYQVRIERG